MQLSKNQSIKLIGLNYRDNFNNAKKFINEFGNPYSRILIDKDGTLGVEFGAYGVPETFLIDKNKDIIENLFGPIIKKLLMKLNQLLNENFKIFILLFLITNFSELRSDEINDVLKNKILKNIRCLICQGQSVYDSESEFASSIKLIVDRKINEGLKEKQINNF